MAKTIQQAIIIGGGIGGLCTAIALRQIGIDVRVYERTEAFERVGAGLAVWANAIRSLRKLDLADQVIEESVIIICHPYGLHFGHCVRKECSLPGAGL
jgi:2-polyprenyl-6-methoxyphenol hydroxylase-like FAD-dependent oxidoreductase